jgi:divalent metal cation (Fe/Co/Zn/Cd) transporter
MEATTQDNNNTSPNPLGKTFWEYYKANYLIVLVVSAILAALTIMTMFWDGFNWIAVGVLLFFIALNIFVVWYSHYQYKKQI